MREETFTADQARALLMRAIAQLQVECLDSIDELTNKVEYLLTRRWYQKLFGISAKTGRLTCEEVWQAILGLEFNSSRKFTKAAQSIIAETVRAKITERVDYCRDAVLELQKVLRDLQRVSATSEVVITHNLTRNLNDY